MRRVKERNNLRDQYYTTQDVVDHCVQLINKKIKRRNLWLLDCSCGDNYFAHQMKLPHVSIDIEPKDCFVSQKTKQIITDNFLTAEIDLPDKEFIIGFNPPFGLRNDLAKKFLRKIFHYKPKYIALILLTPTNKNGWNFQGYKTLIEEQLPEESFVHNNKVTKVPCTFYLVEREQAPNKTPKFLPRNEKYTMKNKFFRVERNKTSKPSEYCIAARFVGAYAGLQYYIFHEDDVYYIDYKKEITELVDEPKHKIQNVFTLVHAKHDMPMEHLFYIVHQIFMQKDEYMNKDAIRSNLNTNDVKRIIDQIALQSD